ncbi:DsbA family protein [Reinekea thalattae]|uniref:DsbA family protein n=1 Tax=Reinekea thalattae TaxID=2593301 RepID=A0A5C8ZD96_9GAMM|nr:DsbA family protein [Reinekea thalattae]TXR54830.1 DsbA family protein [Reinekea thalattae]
MKAVKLFRPISLATLIMASTSTALVAEEFEKSDIEQIVHQYIIDNPEVVAEAIYKLQNQAKEEQARQEALSLKQMTAQLTNNPIDPVGGNPNGSVTIVEFFDYNCGYCKRANGTLQQLIADNPDLKVVYKEWPILSEGSAKASNIALAVNLAYPDKYQAFHRALLESRSVRTENDAWAVVERVGLDRAKVEKELSNGDIAKHLQETKYLAQQLGITGTPAFVVGGQILKGAYPQEDIQRAIDAAKES